jgi:hypothetical protein
MPVLGQDDMSELRGEPVDHRDDRVAVRHCERPARTEIVLHIDDHQNIAIARRPSARVSFHLSLADLSSDR